MTAKGLPDGSFRRRPDAAWRRIGEEVVVLDLRTGAYFSLNETAALIWEELDGGATRAKAAARLCAEFDADEERAARDVDELVAALLREGVLEPAP
ncbi:MAG: PqqD family protein [Elusimicrobia bacterium]|nr:PqqD family protein [Elusimicrobiota bacterium]